MCSYRSCLAVTLLPPFLVPFARRRHDKWPLWSGHGRLLLLLPILSPKEDRKKTRRRLWSFILSPLHTTWVCGCKRSSALLFSFVKLFKRHSPPISCCCCCCCSVCETLSSSSSSSCPFYNLVLSDVNTNSSSESLCVVFSDSFSFCCYSSSTSRAILINNLSLFFKSKKCNLSLLCTERGSEQTTNAAIGQYERNCCATDWLSHRRRFRFRNVVICIFFFFFVIFRRRQ